MLSEENDNGWDKERHAALNTHFRHVIHELLRTDPYLAEAASAGKEIQLPDLIQRMSEVDQERWHEYMQLDRIKLHMDMKNHLYGEGSPYQPKKGFEKEKGDKNEDELW